MEAARPKLSTMLARGVRKHCARCGAPHLFTSWFKMRERCPNCGYRFDRGTSSGFFLGAYMLNLVVSEMALGVVLLVLIIRAAIGHAGAWWPYILVAAITQVTVPLIFYPFSKTIWAAFDLLVLPLDAVDEAEAIVSAADQKRMQP
ncbi:MAG TPA: DUF983 domain-containing protein [Actinomycetota bacterium]|nr:DUF983 domain-containing protein [Actinomycetota bacterium]